MPYSARQFFPFSREPAQIGCTRAFLPCRRELFPKSQTRAGSATKIPPNRQRRHSSIARPPVPSSSHHRCWRTPPPLQTQGAAATAANLVPAAAASEAAVAVAGRRRRRCRHRVPPALRQTLLPRQLLQKKPSSLLADAAAAAEGAVAVAGGRRGRCRSRVPLPLLQALLPRQLPLSCTLQICRPQHLQTQAGASAAAVLDRPCRPRPRRPATSASA